MTGTSWAGKSDTGLKRSCNQDRFKGLPSYGIYVVADGMGGAASGDVAADAVVSALPTYLERYLTPSVEPSFVKRTEDEVKAALCDLSVHIREKSSRSLLHAGMGTTVVVALIRERQALLAHIGDSRIYMWRAGALTRITRDHTLAQALIDSGDLTPEEAAARSGLHRLTMYVGMAERPSPTVTIVGFNEGDRLLLCSDGLTSMVDDASIAALLRAHTEPNLACAALIDAANEAGGRDNTTALIVQRDAKIAVRIPESNDTTIRLATFDMGGQS